MANKPKKTSAVDDLFTAFAPLLKEHKTAISGGLIGWFLRDYLTEDVQKVLTGVLTGDMVQRLIEEKNDGSSTKES